MRRVFDAVRRRRYGFRCTRVGVDGVVFCLVLGVGGLSTMPRFPRDVHV